ncbi:MAG: GntR family transcriptional regulator [Barnesiella sp.]|nr:GntR family transcriptional regulator [Bacteroidales bacterium]MBD5250401.1 GntR family transcriptional regulator [Barnesiella sp.]MBD5344302.1 GntR family transcriptional regulator [Bacteroides sp.]MDE5829470.1 GntR family transcriptional regulator [Duncaniella sp.]
MVAFKENNKSIFLQIADMVCEDILAGRLKGGQRMLSVRECAGEMEVNVNTVMRSYEYLAQQGVIFNRRGIGFFVAEDAAEVISNRRRSEFLEGEMSDVFRQLYLLNVTPEQLTAMYKEYISKIK